jgi:hypothetical protein
MQKLKISSVSLMLTLFVSALTLILMQNYRQDNFSSFLLTAISLPIAMIIILVYFVPSVIIKKRSGLDFFSFAQKVTPSAVVFVSAFYAMYFVYLIEYFLLGYVQIFKLTLNPDASGFVVALLMLLVAVFAARKGIAAVTRFAIFVFAFSLLFFALIFGGSLSGFDFEVNSSIFDASYSDFILSVSKFMTLSFAAVIFSSTAGVCKSFKVKHLVLTIAAILLVILLSIFFIWFVLGEYGKQQSSQMFLLSKSAKLGVIGGLDSFFLAVLAMAMFVLTAIALICIDRAVQRPVGKSVSALFALITLVLFICAENINSVKEILTSAYIFNILNFVAALLIPAVYLICFRRRLGE